MVLADAYVNVRDSIDVKGLIDAAHLLERLPSLPCLRFVAVRGLDMASAFFSKTLSCPSCSPTLTPSCITHCTSRTARHALHVTHCTVLNVWPTSCIVLFFSLASHCLSP